MIFERQVNKVIITIYPDEKPGAAGVLVEKGDKTNETHYGSIRRRDYDEMHAVQKLMM